MARDDEMYDEPLDHDLLEGELLDDEDEDRPDEAVAGIGAWGISVILHAVALLLLAVVVFMQPEEDDAPVVAKPYSPPPEQEEPEQERDIIEREVTNEIVAEVVVETPQVHELDVPVEDVVETEDPIESENSAQGRQEAVAASEMGGVSAFMTMGAGGGASGAFGNRSGGGRRTAVGRFGGSRASESAVEAALEWFKRHQSPNGQWDVDGYPQNCTLPGPKCEPGTSQTDDGGDGDAACTGYALLCYLGAGYDHGHPNKYRQVVQRGLDYLLSIQNQDGGFGSRGRNYENGVCAMALAEAYAMTQDPNLREPAQRAVDRLLELQLQGADGYPLAWNYKEPNPTRVDSSVSGWCVMALKSAKAGGLEVGDGMEGSRRWLQAAWEAFNPDHERLDGGTGSSEASDFPYKWDPTTGVAEGSGRACIGGLCAVFLGLRQGDVLLETLTNYVMARNFPDSYPTDTYYMYYNTLFIFQVGGERWERWNGTVRDMLVDAQRAEDDCFDGSWNPEGAGRHHVSEVGRLLVTAYCTLSLEVYYRYMPVALQQQ